MGDVHLAEGIILPAGLIPSGNITGRNRLAFLVLVSRLVLKSTALPKVKGEGEGKWTKVNLERCHL